jgi:G patch domain-containing protein 1
MDEEDLAEAEESKRIQTQAAFAGLGSTADDVSRASDLMGLFRVQGETMGVKLLKRMGWKEGQGIGPKIRRKARLDLSGDANETGDTYLFAPENARMISFVRKTDHKGLGYGEAPRLTPIGLSARGSGADDSEEDDDQGIGYRGRPKFSLAPSKKKSKVKAQGGFGTGVLNETGSDEEDPYEIGPRISYNRVIGGERKKKKAITSTNPTVKTKPTFIAPSKKAALGKVALGIRKCHDGRLPLEGFVFGREPDTLISAINAEGKYPPPIVPPGWVPSKQAKPEAGSAAYISTADAAKASTLDPKSRAAILGEKQLPGKSVFDFLSADSRERLAALTGRTDLPPARGEVPAGYALSEAERLQELLSRVPQLDKETAISAISRGAGGGAPYADDDAKRSRYIAFLEYQAGFKPTPGEKPRHLNNEEWLREMHEFFNCARIFKPMTGFMASRFTTSSTAKKSENGEKDLVPELPPKPQDPAEEAAELGMFGPMTRSVTDFYPTRLLCKRFNVKPPEHVQPDDLPGPGSGNTTHDAASGFGAQQGYGPTRQQLLALESGSASTSSHAIHGGVQSGSKSELMERALTPEKNAVDSSRNDALEGQRAGEEVFKAIFGDSDDEN